MSSPLLEYYLLKAGSCIQYLNFQNTLDVPAEVQGLCISDHEF